MRRSGVEIGRTAASEAADTAVGRISGVEPAGISVPAVRRDLPNARMGQLVGWDGRTYSQQTARIERDEIEALVEAGCPVVTYLPGGRLVWQDEEDAWPAWADARSAPQSVTAGRWESVDGGVAVVLVWHA